MLGSLVRNSVSCHRCFNFNNRGSPMSAAGLVPSSRFMTGDGNGYELQMGRWSRRLAPLFIDFAGIKGGHVLDVGCGIGSLAFALSQNQNVKSISAIDFSPIYIKHAQQLTNDPGFSSRWATRVHYHSRTPPLITPLHFWSSPLSPRPTSPCARCSVSPDPVELSP